MQWGFMCDYKQITTTILTFKKQLNQETDSRDKQKTEFLNHEVTCATRRSTVLARQGTGTSKVKNKLLTYYLSL